jgi:hypothetical protein
MSWYRAARLLTRTDQLYALQGAQAAAGEKWPGQGGKDGARSVLVFTAHYARPLSPLERRHPGLFIAFRAVRLHPIAIAIQAVVQLELG